MYSKNESVAVRAAEALLDRGYGRSMHGMDVIDQDKALIEKTISVVFVKPGERISSNPTSNLLTFGGKLNFGRLGPWLDSVYRAQENTPLSASSL